MPVGMQQFIFPTIQFNEATQFSFVARFEASLLFTQRDVISKAALRFSTCVYKSLFTGLLSRNASGVEYPLTLSGTQRNDGAWDTTLGNGDAVVEHTGARGSR